MNILYIADSSSWHNAKWTEYFAERHNVFLFSDYKDDYKPVKFHPAVNIIQIPPIIKTGNRHFNKLSSVFLYRSEIESIISKYNIDVIHSVALYYAYLASTLDTKIPIIYTQQGSELLVRCKTSMVYRYMAKKAFSRASMVTGDSLTIQRAGIKYGASKNNNHIIQNGVDTKKFFPSKNFNSQKLNNRLVRLCSPRAITDLYNIDIILNALSILDKEYEIDFTCDFTFGFGDENLQKYKDLASKLGISDKLNWIGYVDHSEMPAIFESADISISVPSSDSSPRSVYESMACGTPVIVSNLPWTNENVTNLKDILISEVQSSQDLACKLVQLINDSDLYKNIRFNGLNLVNNKFSYCVEMNKMEKLMQGLIE
ncbi:hypothetical protein BCT05_06875 [Vibrio breoganii]|uniref:glycosyltransferase family 4 protein n=1 Tax=Vibrio breoganii TaxID=553239 RepID=UPI000C866A6B|nr:glycosyltransferase [Vibrio breoganii]PMO67494.1 hypothetical protein BCT05_06875 [Vibrio breoganii]